MSLISSQRHALQWYVASQQRLGFAGTPIRRDAEGRYCLNDLHKAAGGKAKNKPANWLRTQQTQDLIAEIDGGSIAQNRAIESKQQLGTFVAKELVYAYAMWISAAFHLKVSREIAELTGKQHAHVMRDCRTMLVELYGEEGLSKFGSSYFNNQNKEQPEFLLPKRETLILVSGYSVQKNAPDQNRAKFIRENADLTGKRHDNIIADIRKMLAELHGEGGLLKFQASYLNSQNKEMPEYQLPKRETLILVSGYSVQMRAKIIDRWQELEAGAPPVLNLRDPLQIAAAQRAPYPMLVELYGEEGLPKFGDTQANPRQHGGLPRLGSPRSWLLM